jgi:DNA (cytosine-5)-methyltransferase 1
VKDGCRFVGMFSEVSLNMMSGWLCGPLLAADDADSYGMTSVGTVVDLFSGAGGMSAGFHYRNWDVVGAVDAQKSKPSARAGALRCNDTYAANIGVHPHELDLGAVSADELVIAVRSMVNGRELDVLAACPPCTGFSRANPNNHMVDDPRNALIGNVMHVVEQLSPKVVVMENAREFVEGNFAQHWETAASTFNRLGYDVEVSVHMLSDIGVPQFRERAIVIAARDDFDLRTLDDLWAGFQVKPSSVTVRHAIAHLPPVAAGQSHPDDPLHVSPAMGKELTLRRLHALPADGGSWKDLVGHPDADELLTGAMKKHIAAGKWGSFPDVYGRMWWDRPAPTIKRESSHMGNGRYSHPEQHRLCTLREMALLNGFPEQFQFAGTSLSNKYRHVGDAVPPIVSFQLAAVAEWILTGQPVSIVDAVLPGTSFTVDDIVRVTSSAVA